MRSIAALLVLAAASLAAGQLQGVITPAAAASAAGVASAALQQGVHSCTAHAAAMALKRLGKEGTPAQCDVLAGVAKDASSPGAAAQSAVALKLLGCSSQLSAAAPGLAASVAAGLNSDSLTTLSLAVQAAPLVNAQLDADAAAAAVLSHVVQGAVFAPTTADADEGIAEGSATAAGITALASLYSKISQGSPASKSVKKVVSSLGTALASVELGSSPAALGLATHSALRLAKAAKASSTGLTVSLLSDIGSSLLPHTASSSPHALAGALTAFKTLGAKKSGAVPLIPAITTTSPSLAQGDSTLTVDVSTVWSAPLAADVTLIKAKPTKGAPVASDVTLGPSPANIASLAADWAPGKYALTLRVTAGEGAEFEPVTLKTSLVVQDAPATWGEAVVLVNAAGGALGQQRAALSHPKAASKAFTVGPGQTLKVLLSGTSAVAREAFLLLTHGESGVTAAFKAVASGEAAGADALTFTVDASSRAALGAAVEVGVYTATLVSGAGAGRAWPLGRVDLTPPTPVPGPTPPLYTETLLHDSDVATGPLPPIAHAFSPPAPRPPIFVSAVFAGVVATLLFALVAYYAGTAGSVTWRRDLPIISGSVFFLALGGVLATFTLYWLNAFNMFVTLGYLAGLSIPLMLAGGRFLRALRVADDAEAGKTE